MNQEEFIERIQDWFSDVNIDTAKLNDYFEQKDFSFGAPHLVGSMRLDEIAVTIWLDRADDDITPGIHLELLEPTDENDKFKEFLPTDEKQERPFFYGGSYSFQSIQECNDFQKLAEFVEMAAQRWDLEWAESKLRNLTGTIREDVNILRNRWSEGHEFPRTGTGRLNLVAEDGSNMVTAFGVFRDEQHSGKLTFDIGFKDIQKDINGQERSCDLVFTNGKLTIRTAPDGYSPFDGRAEGVEYFKPSVGDIKMFCGAFELFHEEAQKFNELIVAKEMLLAADAVLMELAKAADRGEKTGLTFEKALEMRGIDKEDFMEQVKKAGKSREFIEGASIAGGAIRLESQQARKEAAKVLSGWMKKPGEKIAKEIETMKTRNQVQGR